MGDVSDRTFFSEAWHMSGIKYLDLKLQRFGRLVAQKKVLGHSGRTITKGGWCTTPAMWECKCDCGNTHIVASKNLKSGATRSCGCLAKENRIRMGKAIDKKYKFKKKEEYTERIVKVEE